MMFRIERTQYIDLSCAGPNSSAEIAGVHQTDYRHCNWKHVYIHAYVHVCHLIPNKQTDKQTVFRP